MGSGGLGESVSKDEQLVSNAQAAARMDNSLWSFSVHMQATQAGWSVMFNRMTEDEKDGWLAWDKAWLECQDVRDGYAALRALRDL